jgi:polar amino acid transport system substrate-binding protein
MRTFRPYVLVLLASLLAACGPGASTAPSASPPAAASPSAAASDSAEPSASPSDEASASASPEPSGSATADGVSEECMAENLQTKTAGTLTIGTDNPAFPPYFLPREGGNTEPWDPSQGDPTTGEGFESAVAYAVAEALGFSEDQVEWVVAPFANSFAPGPKEFDFDINQVSFTEERTENADLSEGYYFGNQAVVVAEDGEFADATTITELKEARLGAQVGTTSFSAIEEVIQPNVEPSVYDSNDAAIDALDAGQIDGIVVDLPTAFYVIFVQTEGNTVVGQIGPDVGAEPQPFSLVLEKDSPITDCVNEAILSLREAGTLDDLALEWLEDETVPQLQP